MTPDRPRFRTLTIPRDEAEEILVDDVFWFSEVFSGRWTRHMKGVFQQDGKYWLIEWEEGLTEMQDIRPFEGTSVEVHEAESFEVVETHWRKKPESDDKI